MSIKKCTTEEAQSLLPHHCRMLEDRAIPIEFAIKHGVRSVDLKLIKHTDERQGRKTYPGMPMPPVTGVQIPYPTATGMIKQWRIRVDQTEYVVSGDTQGTHHGEESGKCPRYLCQAGI